MSAQKSILGGRSYVFDCYTGWSVYARGIMSAQISERSEICYAFGRLPRPLKQEFLVLTVLRGVGRMPRPLKLSRTISCPTQNTFLSAQKCFEGWGDCPAP
eukprot:15854461-Heterocapsa_arctica.AAC.1